MYTLMHACMHTCRVVCSVEAILVWSCMTLHSSWMVVSSPVLQRPQTITVCTSPLSVSLWNVSSSFLATIFTQLNWYTVHFIYYQEWLKFMHSWYYHTLTYSADVGLSSNAPEVLFHNSSSELVLGEQNVYLLSTQYPTDPIDFFFGFSDGLVAYVNNVSVTLTIPQDGPFCEVRKLSGIRVATNSYNWGDLVRKIELMACTTISYLHNSTYCQNY